MRWLWLLTWLLPWPGAAGAAGDASPLPVAEVAPGVFVHAGVHGEASAENLGSIANVGFIVGERCVAVIDSGGSRAAGMRLLAALRKVSALPVCYVINTHMHPDHVFGNAAFVAEAAGATVVGHAKLAAALTARERGYLERIRQELGEAAAGTRVVLPTMTVSDTKEIDLGGRTLLLRAWPTAHTDNDLSVFDRSTRTLFAGDLLFVERIPSIDGSLRGWLKVLAELRRLEPAYVVAGHGEAGANWPQAVTRLHEYLSLVLDQTRAAIRAGRTIQQAVAEVGASERGRWQLFDDYHRRNVTAAFAELEWED